jgi:FkbM family methyltransferase
MAGKKTKFLNVLRSTLMFPAAEKMLAKITAGKSVISPLSAKMIPNHYQYEKGTFRDVFRDGIKLNVDISDYVGHFIYFGFPDSGIRKLLSLASDANTIIDAGANIGFTGLLLKANSPKESKVFAFEPDAYNFSQLRKNIALNPEHPVHIINKGLGKTAGEFKLIIEDESNRGMNKISDNADGKFETINVITLDEFAENNDLKKIDLIKIDTEGFEFNIISGAKKTIEKHRPSLFVELDDNNLRKQGSSAKELIRLLEENYSKIINAENGKPLSSGNDFSNCHFDIIVTNKVL